ncbi:general transcription factor II-I repeat domain-containing protein 2-like [Alligator mississippiensis]|uniref:general transcription factor II-I repeat domain-containing protein 2-like n=1 Tax=Alligator mississippiensis TaxID=8496 RepID=UPI000711CC6D|nr:general transcription factor II-I repeat domain-containing protein 2-like [Alligator mississippiensis]XP_019337941.1 general transcription factor II-I repeat domain-containing protein 2-like [Alligator mississippiensis]XP_019337943.1 general transcription factor II-I repeat domain-containing protein 2-like [Alligator mississippiensis]XP_059588480.1 general transcription factor II-I repeat domain-containing protein 2-like [Alligator mississippiensis]XP_059588481.1 general transcription factor
MSSSKKRKVDAECQIFNKEWTSKYFFIDVGGKPACLICKESMAVFKEYNLNRHFESKHASKYKNLSAKEKAKKTEEMVAGMQKEQTRYRMESAQDGIMRTSYEIAHTIVKNSKPFSEGEFIKECLVVSATILCPEKNKLFENICLSRQTIERHVEDISKNLDLQLKRKVNNFSYFALALQESCVKDPAHFLMFIRGISKNFELTEELASVQSMEGTTTGKDLLEAVNQCMSKLEVDWKKLVCVTINTNPNLTDKHTGLLKSIQDQVKETNPEQNIIFLHCSIHQEALYRSVLKLSTVMDTVTKLVNYIRVKGLNHRQFVPLLEESESEHTDVLYHTNVRWLSLGKVLKSVWKLRTEIGLFLNLEEKDSAFPQLNDADWLSEFAFAVDIVGLMNDLNSRLHRKGLFAHELHFSVKSFMMKLLLFSHQIGNKEFSNFPTLQQVTVCDQNLEKYMSSLLNLHAELSRQFEDFQMIENDLSLVSSPFTFDVDNAPSELQLELIDLQCDALLVQQFKLVPLPRFYASLNEQNFQKIKANAQKMLVVFGSMYICEQTFSVMKVSKSNLRFSVSDDQFAGVVRIATTEMMPDFDSLVNSHSRLHS